MNSKILAIAALALTMAACNMKAPLKVGYEAPADAVAETDSVIYGFCGRQSTPEQLQLITSTDDTLYFNVEEARKKGKVLAGYSHGDEIYVVPSSDRTEALLTINKNNLLGHWVMPSPFDGSTPSGIILKDGGEAENFEQQGDLIYKAWNIINGHLQLTTTRDDGTDIYETQTYEITRMTPDSLYLRNIDDQEDTFEYGRYKEEPEVNLDIELDNSAEDDYNLF
jgi:predicted small lipoprotein YifL